MIIFNNAVHLSLFLKVENLKVSLKYNFGLKYIAKHALKQDGTRHYVISVLLS